jgi:hypothetical protein
MLDYYLDSYLFYFFYDELVIDFFDLDTEKD